MEDVTDSLPRAPKRHGFRARWATAIVASAFLLAACARFLPSQQEGFSQAYANDVLEAGYAYITDRYIDDLTARELAVAGLGGLGDLDRAFSISDQGGVVVARVDGKELGVRQPRGEAPQDWARYSARIVDAARAQSEAIQAADSETIFKVVFDASLSDLDGFSRYSGADDAADARAMREGFGGIGMTIRMDEEDATILAVIEGAPAARAGIQPQDRISQVDGQPIAGWTQRELIQALRGRVGTAVRLQITRSDRAEVTEHNLRRQQIVPPTVVVERQGRVAVLKVSSFNQRTARTVAQQVSRLRRERGGDTDGIILDLRDNPGGLLDQAVEVADIFLSQGEIVATRGRHPHSEQRYNASGSDLSGGMPLVVLVNGNSASASEVVAAALQDQGRGILIGTNSYGKGTVQTVYRLPNDGELTLTWSRLHAPSGYRLHGLGVLPTVCSHGGGLASDTGDLIASLRNGSAPARNLFNDWRTAPRVRDDDVAVLRQACAADNGAPLADIEVAAALLSDPALYRRVLENGAGAIAHRP